jgi:hypothetical protein
MTFDQGNRKTNTARIAFFLVVMGIIIFSRVLWYVCGKGKYESNFFIVYSPSYIGSLVLYKSKRGSGLVSCVNVFDVIL